MASDSPRARIDQVVPVFKTLLFQNLNTCLCMRSFFSFSFFLFMCVFWVCLCPIERLYNVVNFLFGSICFTWAAQISSIFICISRRNEINTQCDCRSSTFFRFPFLMNQLICFSLWVSFLSLLGPLVLIGAIGQYVGGASSNLLLKIDYMEFITCAVFFVQKEEKDSFTGFKIWETRKRSQKPI